MLVKAAIHLQVPNVSWAFGSLPTEPEKRQRRSRAGESGLLVGAGTLCPPGSRSGPRLRLRGQMCSMGYPLPGLSSCAKVGSCVWMLGGSG